MAAPAKFLFDTDFAAPDRTRERAATAAEIAQKVAEAEARAYRAGYEAAQHEARVESDRRAALALEEIGITIRGIATRFSGIEARMETEAVEVAVAVARKLCSELIAANRSAKSPPSSAIVSRIGRNPHLVVRIHDQLTKPPARRSNGSSPERLRGRLVILPSPASPPATPIEWADGGRCWNARPSK